MPMNIRYKNHQAEFVHIGEGLYGDYVASDPGDVALLRLDTYELVNGEWEAIDGGSVCTRLSVDTDPEIMEEALCWIVLKLDEIGDGSKRSLVATASAMRSNWFTGDTNRKAVGE